MKIFHEHKQIACGEENQICVIFFPSSAGGNEIKVFSAIKSKSFHDFLRQNIKKYIFIFYASAIL